MATSRSNPNLNLHLRRNILILAENGLNKLAWLNKWANYLTFPRLSLALRSNFPPYFVECSSSVTVDVFKGKPIDRSLRFIDAPDGWDVNCDVFDKVLAYVKQNSVRIHGVILLLRWSEFGFFLNNFSVEFKSSLNALLDVLNRDAAENALFCFIPKIERIDQPYDSWYRAGSLIKLREHFIKSANERIEVSVAEGIVQNEEYCIDSDPFFYLQHVKTGVMPRDSNTIVDYEMQWSQARSNLSKVLDLLIKPSQLKKPIAASRQAKLQNSDKPLLYNSPKDAKKGSQKKPSNKNKLVKWTKKLAKKVSSLFS